MPRPRAQSDDDILDRIAAHLSSSTWTLADAAGAAGVHSATLIKRFGSRHGVLAALSRRWIEGIPTEPVEHGGFSELESWVATNGQTPQDRAGALAGLAMVMEDLRDDELADLLREGWGRQVDYLAVLVQQAQEEGRLRRAPTAPHAAQLLLDAGHGALLRAAAGQAPRSTESPGTILPTLLESWT